MKKVTLFTVLIVNLVIAIAQDPTVKEIQKEAERKNAKDTTSGWRKGGVISINIGQGSSRNWAAGAEKFSFSTASSVNLFAAADA